MFPPLTTAAVFSPRAFTTPAMHAATLAAPAGSATVFILSSMKKIALAMSASLTSTMSSTYFRISL